MNRPIAAIFVLLLAPLIVRAADLTGRVLDPDDKPVAHATVYCFGPASPSPPRAAPTTQADDQGQFRFPNISGAHQVVAFAPPMGLGMAADAGDGKPAEIHLTKATDLTARFVTEDNQPAAGVRVVIQMFSYSEPGGGNATVFRLPRGYRSPWIETTDANGQCTFTGLPQGGRVLLATFDPRFIRLTPRDAVMLSWSAETTSDPITLTCAATITGRMTYGPTGNPAKGVTVDADLGGTTLTSAITNASGEYSLRQLRPGKYTLALHPNPDLQKAWTAVAIQNVDVAAGATKADQNLTLIPGGVLAGAVTAPDHRPLAGVAIKISGPAHPRDEAPPETVTTNSAGHFFLRVPAGEQLVSISSPTAISGFGLAAAQQTTITVADGGHAELNIQLAPAAPPPPPIAAISTPMPPPRIGTPIAAMPPAEVIPSSPPAASIYDPADAVTWRWWFYSAVLLVAGCFIGIFISAVNAMRGPKNAG